MKLVGSFKRITFCTVGLLKDTSSYFFRDLGARASSGEIKKSINQKTMNIWGAGSYQIIF